MRKAKSSLVGMILDTLLMVHADVPPRVERVHEYIYEKRKALHVVAFAQLLASPGGFDIAEHPHMHSFHATVVNVGGVATVGADISIDISPLVRQGDTFMHPSCTAECVYIPTHPQQIEAFGCAHFREFVTQLKLRIPEGGRRLTLNNLSFIHVGLCARLTVQRKEDGSVDYGALDERVYTQDKFEVIQSWLMNPDECPTTWDELLRIRAENPNYGQYYDSTEHRPLRTTPEHLLFSRTPSPVCATAHSPRCIKPSPLLA